VKKHEVEMAEVLEALRAPQSRRILEELATTDVSLDNLTKRTRFSEASIQLHLQPLIKAKLVSRKKNGLLKLNWVKFNQISNWFRSISDSE
jgi:DNA-binding transcriptional ArsR family regulator